MVTIAAEIALGSGGRRARHDREILAATFSVFLLPSRGPHVGRETPDPWKKESARSAPASTPPTRSLQFGRGGNTAGKIYSRVSPFRKTTVPVSRTARIDISASGCGEPFPSAPRRSSPPPCPSRGVTINRVQPDAVLLPRLFREKLTGPRRPKATFPSFFFNIKRTRSRRGRRGCRYPRIFLSSASTAG